MIIILTIDNGINRLLSGSHTLIPPATLNYRKIDFFGKLRKITLFHRKKLAKFREITAKYRKTKILICEISFCGEIKIYFVESLSTAIVNLVFSIYLLFINLIIIVK